MAAHRWRIGAVRGPTVLGVIVAGVLVIAVVITGRWQAPGRPATRPPAPPAAAVPLSLGPTRACPLAAPVPGFADHRSYPPGHPAAPPRSVRPVACYQTTMLATMAGYPPAPHRPGRWRSAGSTSPPPASSSAAAASGPPTAWASRSPAPGCCRPCRRVRCRRPPVTSGSPARRAMGLGLCWRRTGSWCHRGYVGAAGQAHGRLVVAAANQATNHIVACEGRQRPVATVTPHGIRGRLVQCTGSGVHYASVLVRWRERGVVMVVSVLGHDQLQQQLAMTVAEHARVVSPGNPRRGSPVSRPRGLGG
jgi:hypothetical protein